MKVTTRGFTLIELLTVIGIIAILAVVVLVAINPSRQFASARDSQRHSHLYSITSAAFQYAVENNGVLPGIIPDWVATSGCAADACQIGTAGIDLSTPLVPKYIPEIPQDPTSGNSADTGYQIFINVDDRLVASASSELDSDSDITIVR